MFDDPIVENNEERKPYRFPGETPGEGSRETSPWHEEDTSVDVHLFPIVAGCGVSAVASIAYALVVVGVLLVGGADLMHIDWNARPGLTVLGFFAGLGASFLGGYVTARVARQAKRLHAIILAIVTMLFAVVGMTEPNHASSWLSAFLQFLLALPVTYWGASVAIERGG